jgi:hypothetical protein
VVTAMTILAAAVVAYYGLYLLLVAEREIGIGEGETIFHSYLVPQSSGIIPLAGSLMMIAGLTFRRQLSAWAGFGVIAVFSVLFMFGVGWELLPAIPTLLILMIMVSLLAKTSREQFTGQQNK